MKIRLYAFLALALGTCATIWSIGVPCPLFSLTGVHCPTCGLTRSVLAMVRGDLNMSLTYHPAGILLGAVCMLALLRPRQILNTVDGVTRYWMKTSAGSRNVFAVAATLAVWSWSALRVIPA